MIEACERRILEFPRGMNAREVARELKTRGLVCLGDGIRQHCCPDRARAGESGNRS